MSLVERITKDLHQSMKDRDAARTSVLRMLKSALKNREIEKRGSLSDDDAVQVLKTQLKQRREAIGPFEAGGRPGLAEKERGEEAIITSYLPEPVSAEQVEEVVSEVIRDKGAGGPKDMGVVMKEVMARLQSTGRIVDGKAVNKRVREKLQALAEPPSAPSPSE